MRTTILAALLFPSALLAASCGGASPGDSAPTSTGTPAGAQGVAAIPGGERVSLPGNSPFAATAHGSFAEPWALAVAPGTQTLFITEKAGTMKFVDTATGRTGTVSGLPRVDYGGQGGLGDVAFLPGESSAQVGGRTIYLTWVEAGEGDTRGAAMGRGMLQCATATACSIENLQVIWRQAPKVTGRGHFSHRIAFSPDGQHLFLAAGDRQKLTPAQDLSNTIGKVLRLNLDGTPAAGNPFADRGGVSREIWTFGNRNIYGLDFDEGGRLWGAEHGPRGGDELNLLERGNNYGWPLVSNGVHYDRDPIPDHSTRLEFTPPVVSWTPVIAPGGFLFYSGAMWPEWQGDALIAGLSSEALIRVDMAGESASEAGRYSFGNRLRDIAEGPDGSLWIIEDGEGGRLLRLTPN